MNNDECYDVEMPLVSNTSDAESAMILLESTISYSSKLITDSMSAFISSLYPKSNITRRSVDAHFGEFGHFMTGYNVRIAHFTNLLLESKLDPAVIKTYVRDAMLASNETIAQLNTEHKRFKFFESLGTYMPPIEITVGNRVESNVKGMHAPCKFQLMPIDKILQKLMSLDHIFKAIVDYLELVRINSEPLVHITQGTSWQKKNYTSSENLLHLPIILYGDDFEVNNPLGSNASIQKLCGIYIPLPFLPPQMVCQLSFLLILALFHSLDRRTFGNEKMFQSITSKLNSLSKDVSAVTADNLGLNCLMGFVENFSSNSYCRICLGNKIALQSLFREDESLLRDRESYEQHLSQNNYCKTGVKERCIFLAMDNFSLFDDTAVDLLHDYL